MATNLERPDEHEAGAAKEAYCWMPGNMDRECGADCVAYDKRSVTDPKVGACMALNSLRSIGLSLVKLTTPATAISPPAATLPGGR